jgi:L,D-transpeptidase catalytic domain
MPSLKGIFVFVLTCAAAFLQMGCQSTDLRYKGETLYLGGYNARDGARGNFDNYSHWDGDGVPGAPSLVIRLSHQRAYFYKAGEMVGVSTISTGREGFGTPRGNFKILQKDKDHASSLYGDYVDAKGGIIRRDIDRSKDPLPPGAKFDGAKMPFFMRITGGVGMHEGFLPGYPASHGCIRMPRAMAEAFFKSVEVGTPVRIEP